MAGYSKRKKITITGGASGAQTDFQIKLTVTYDGDMQSDFDDLRFTQSDGETLIDAWLETKTDDVSATVWAEFPTTPANTVEADYYMYYGKAVASDWDGAATFIQYNGETSTSFKLANVQAPAMIAEARISQTNSLTWDRFGTSNTSPNSDDAMYLLLRNNMLAQTNTLNEGSNTYDTVAGAYSLDAVYKIVNDVSNVKYYRDDVLISTIATNVPDESMGLYYTHGTGTCYYAFIRKYAANPPTYAFGAEESAPTGGNPFWYYQMLRKRNQ